MGIRGLNVLQGGEMETEGGDPADKGPVDPVDEVRDDELDELEAEGAADVEFLDDDAAASDDTVDNEEGEDTPASDEVRSEATGDD